MTLSIGSCAQQCSPQGWTPGPQNSPGRRYTGILFNQSQKHDIQAQGSVPPVEHPGMLSRHEPERPTVLDKGAVLGEPVRRIPPQSSVDHTELNFQEKTESAVDAGFQQNLSQLAQAVYQAQSAQLVQETDHLIRKGIDSLQHPVSRRLYGQQEYMKLAGNSEIREFQLEVMTREGDRVAIEINMDKGLENFRYQYRADDQVHRGNEVSDFLNHTLAVTVQGSLDPDELGAISDLISEITSLAGSFYSGSYSEALSQAVEIGMDADELAGFTLDLSHEKKVYAANVVSDLSTDESRAIGFSRPGKNKSQAVLDGVRNLADHRALPLFDNPADALKALFQKIAEQVESVLPSPADTPRYRFSELLDIALSSAGHSADSEQPSLFPTSLDTIDFWA